MNRKEIKELAKAKVKGNKWNILWPMLVISIIESIITGLFKPQVTVDYSNMDNLANMTVQYPTSYYVVSLLAGLIAGIFMAGYLKYLLNYVRGEKFDANVIIETVKEKWLQILIADILVGIIVVLCSLLFVIPGIIMALAYAMVNFIIIDSDTKGNDALKASREMMKGHKWEYFVFILSFIGWFILTPFTLCILLIWLVPYFTIAEVIYYDKLKALTSNK